MGLDRRRFVGSVARAVAVLCIPATFVAQRVPRYVQAVRSRVYPGPRKPLNRADIQRKGHWGG